MTETRFDYDRQAWIRDGRYTRCGHPDSMACACYGRLHDGELAPPAAAVPRGATLYAELCSLRDVLEQEMITAKLERARIQRERAAYLSQELITSELEVSRLEQGRHLVHNIIGRMIGAPAVTR